MDGVLLERQEGSGASNAYQCFLSFPDTFNKLFARRGQLPESEDDPASRSWTSFAMTLREPAPIPVPFDFTRFLVSSLTFMRYLRQVSVFFDDKRLVKLNKAAGVPKNLAIPKGLNNRSPSGIMTVDTIQTTREYFLKSKSIFEVHIVISSSLHSSTSYEMDLHVRF